MNANTIIIIIVGIALSILVSQVSTGIDLDCELISEEPAKQRCSNASKNIELSLTVIQLLPTIAGILFAIQNEVHRRLDDKDIQRSDTWTDELSELRDVSQESKSTTT